jgi:hypothetical protein
MAVAARRLDIVTGCVRSLLGGQHSASTLSQRLLALPLEEVRTSSSGSAGVCWPSVRAESWPPRGERTPPVPMSRRRVATQYRPAADCTGRYCEASERSSHSDLLLSAAV